MNTPFINHIHIYTNHMQEMTRFWVEVANGTIEGPAQYAGEDAIHVMLPAKIRIVVHQKTTPSADKVNYASGINHVGITVTNLEESLALALSLPLVELDKDIFETAAYRCAFIRGADNLRVELMEPK